jgi:hypothetical protein
VAQQQMANRILIGVVLLGFVLLIRWEMHRRFNKKSKP